jgi:hypothetical protein
MKFGRRVIRWEKSPHHFFKFPASSNTKQLHVRTYEVGATGSATWYKVLKCYVIL